MAAYTSLLLVIALCAATVYSLRCYTCELESSNSNCLTETNCTSSATSCLTSVGSGSAGGVSATAIIKRCAVSCTPLTTTISGVTATVTCCSTDLCNYSTSIKSSYAAIILALGSILTVLKSSVLTQRQQIVMVKQKAFHSAAGSPQLHDDLSHEL
ncbi:ly6/PLAUR domain-containing protein 2-like [Bufo bufo]|uniref:ly6/PLAUR domain-containing protein 2-like n=1 Tax=Bufo bufo TaxID=8384 RepID=UPI001ABEDA68|nr:ly6/PLAUR domain-containing protein 2-like [Bufo bufo]